MVAATNQNLEEAVPAHRFRSDLYFRLSVFPIRIPPLRDRSDDIVTLPEYFVKYFAARLRKPVNGMAASVERRLRDDDWPGNVRELQNVIERAVILASGPRIELAAVALSAKAHQLRQQSSAGVVALAEAERLAILAALDAAHWRVSGSGGAAVIRGALAAKNLKRLEHACREALQHQQVPIEIDLTGVTAMDGRRERTSIASRPAAPRCAARGRQPTAAADIPVRLRLYFEQQLSMTALAVQAALAATLAQSPSVPLLDLTISRSTRLLIVAPHPDDGVLGAAGLIRRVISRGGRVRVVWTTSGDGFSKGVASAEGIGLPGAQLTPHDYQSYGLIREHEARAALESLGIRPQSLTFLGFPDDGLCQLASTYSSAKAQPFTSPYTSRISPPVTEQIIRGVQYRGLDLRRELERVVVAFHPTLIVAPHPADEHPDHCSTHIFLKEAIETLVGQGWTRPHVLHYLIHYRGWPLAGEADQSDLLPPAGLAQAGGRWVSLALTPDEITRKRSAVLAYHSQLLVIERFMLAFARTNELFLEGEPASLPKCWCNGENVALEAASPQPPHHPSGP